MIIRMMAMRLRVKPDPDGQIEREPPAPLGSCLPETEVLSFHDSLDIAQGDAGRGGVAAVEDKLNLGLLPPVETLRKIGGDDHDHECLVPVEVPDEFGVSVPHAGNTIVR
jgi:hypothetical protein